MHATLERLPRLLAVLALNAGLLLPGQAAAYRDCCFARSVPPTLIGIEFHGPIDDVLDRLERAGFQDYDPAQRRIAGLATFDDTILPPGPLAPGEIASTFLGPSIARWMLACGASAPPALMPMGGHPNGARRLVAVIAVVPDLDLACGTMANAYRGSWRPAFGPAFDDPATGARIREARFGLGALRVMQPTDPHGAAFRWLENGGPRWIGIAVEVGDMSATEQWLKNEHLPFQRDPTGNPILRIDPDDLDGLLVEFVTPRHI